MAVQKYPAKTPRADEWVQIRASESRPVFAALGRLVNALQKKLHEEARRAEAERQRKQDHPDSKQ
jgi:hypothetical protein